MGKLRARQAVARAQEQQQQAGGTSYTNGELVSSPVSSGHAIHGASQLETNELCVRSQGSESNQQTSSQGARASLQPHAGWQSQHPLAERLSKGLLVQSFLLKWGACWHAGRGLGRGAAATRELAEQ